MGTVVHHRSPLFDTLRDRARSEGEADGLAKGEVREARRKLVRVLKKRGLDVPDEAQERIDSCDDRAVLDLWFDRALEAGSAAEVFGDE
ncbi:hypothetical protein DZF91_36770 [Actinomadura logoneensis]|uniref:DUF4351 domain-containing protein n=1 Tax=Actinomadura logoneensis TaxID=2293572 RepID=A0A372JBD8_9ACTN|nr:hypothetical protein [Actinomadura logoneensis]RFU36708.1 hypothetical protein DZF91_36770 [Actinomadura logoneensis]